MGAISKVRTFVWYLSRPNYRSQIVPLFKRKVLGRNVRGGGRGAVARLNALAIDGQAAVAILYPSFRPRRLVDDHAVEWEEAHARARAVPMKMGGPGETDLLYNLVLASGAQHVIETGVAYGWSSAAILLALGDGGRLASVDLPYAKAGNENFVGICVSDELKHRWTLIRKPDRTGLPEALAAMPEIDLAHYDSDKSYEGRMFAYPLLWHALRPGGLLVSDDIGDNDGFADYADQLGVTPLIVRKGKDLVGILRKP